MLDTDTIINKTTADKEISSILLELISLEKATVSNYDESLDSFIIRLRQYFISKESAFYSDVISLIYKLENGDFEYLEENLTVIYERIEDEDLKGKVFKLLDYIRLENTRLTYLNETAIESIEKLQEKHKEIEELSTQVSDYKKNTENLVNQLRETKEKFDDATQKQKKSIDGVLAQIITILGIFSTIVITFFGGVTAMSAILENMHNVSKFRLVFIFLFIAFVMFNTIFMLLHFIAKLSDRTISSSCSNCKEKANLEDVTFNIQNCKNKNNLKCIKIKYPLVYYFNEVIVFLIIITIIAYYSNYWGWFNF